MFETWKDEEGNIQFEIEDEIKSLLAQLRCSFNVSLLFISPMIGEAVTKILFGTQQRRTVGGLNVA